ncbi:T9SS type A sorting domain-containing protein [Roseivirga sp. BDSF3-8]|uniref:T9SS type A sorting domain-containing protein n=1 Tax=Roseivirga sp. BDSF3-8 TaxID=3241598 RepID=UPI00353241E1
MLKKFFILVGFIALCSGFTPYQTESAERDPNINLGLTDNDLFEAEGIKIGDIYPNPAERFIELKYTISDPGTRVKILFHNVLGVRMAEHSLDAGKSSLLVSTEKFIPGIYFYTLNVNDQNVITKKLVVKK